MASASETRPDTKVTLPEMFYFTKTVHHEAYDKISPLRPELSAQGKNILVTGGGTGIGKSIALEFARAKAKSVTILGRRRTHLEEAEKEIAAGRTDQATTVLFVAADLMKPEDVERAFQTVYSRVGYIDVLVSNAAAMSAGGPLSSYEPEVFMHGFNLNVLSAFNAVQAFLPLAGPKPMIINISTALAHFAPMAGAGSYAISKAANLKMMNYFAVENPDLHVVNVQPGTVTTDMSAQVGVEATDTGTSCRACENSSKVC